MARPEDRWELTLGLDGGSEPLFRRISRAIVAEIQRGRLRPGERLPGSRTFARMLRVHRNTVLAAYEELSAEGWIECCRARGTFVSSALPLVRRRSGGAACARRPSSAAAGFEFRASADVEEADTAAGSVRVLSAGVPDVRLAPAVPLARAFRRVLREGSESLLSYGYPEGHPRLRAALASMLRATRGLAVEAQDVLVTSGSQMALELLGRTLLAPGDVVAIEHLGYRQAWRAFQQHGAALAPIAVDAGGIDVEALAQLAERTALRAVYLTPHHQYPTTATLSAGRRIALLELARAKRIVLIEDDYDHEFHYEGRPVLPMASADTAGVVLYVGSLAKVLAPGVRLGYLVAPRPLLRELVAHRACIDRQGEHTLECAVAELLEQGEAQRHARRARRIYHARRDFLVRSLRRELGSALTFEVPCGGLTLWATAAEGVDVEAWAARVRQQGAWMHTARHYAYDRRVRPHLRLGFAPFEEQEIAAWVRLLRRAL
jgi:GntR family transcriptional regulator/MocR family aminotransferase